MMTSKDLTIAKLEEKLHRVSWNDKLGCYNRQGFEYVIWPDIAPRARFIIYFDIDHLHELNEPYDSFAPVDAMIKQALSIVRTTDSVAGQLNSGDEFMVVLAETEKTEKRKELNPEGLKKRLVESLAEQGMSATFAIVAVKSQDLMENVDPAVAQVKAAKRERGISR